MGFVLTLTIGVLIWIILWSIGIKSFDAFLLAVLIAVLAATVRIGLSYLPRRG